MEVTKRLVSHLVHTTYESLPGEVIEKTKRQILDILGVMAPPTTLERSCRSLAEIAREGRGKRESTLIWFGGKVPSWMAAWVNGSLCHSLDYDDTIDRYVNHPTANTFPAAFAVAEKIRDVTGKDFITAVALGIDLNIRLSAALTEGFENYPWFPIMVFGVFSAAAAVGKLMRLDETRMTSALGIALDRAAGTMESVGSPESEIRAIRDSFANREGVLAALMAQKGIKASPNSIESFYKVFYRNNYDPAVLTARLGTEFMGPQTSFKAWPACRCTHTYIGAARELAGKHGITPDRIREIKLTVGKFGRDYLCTPLEAKRKPEQSINAKFSLPFVMGLAFTRPKITIEDFLPEKLDDPAVLQVAAKVNYEYDSRLPTICPGRVEVQTREGDTLVVTEEIPYGHPSRPMSDADLVAKFKDCARYARKTLPAKDLDRLARSILTLEKAESIAEISGMLP